MIRPLAALAVLAALVAAALLNAFGWPGHPNRLRDRAMAGIGQAARLGQGMPEASLDTLALVARKAPLAAEPYLAFGAAAELAGDGARAERLFLAARLRDPRAVGARYFLAQRYLATGRLDPAVDEVAAMSRLLSATAAMIPALAAAARRPDGEPAIARLLARAPTLREPLLYELADDPDNAELLVRRWAALPHPPGPPPTWQGRIVTRLVDRGEFARARRTWAALAGVAAPAGLYNPGFKPLPAPPPFNWLLQGGSAGLIEPAPGGGLHVVHFGRDDALLASQTLLLAPGRYRLTAAATGGNGATDVLDWRLTCLDHRLLLRLPVRAGANGATFRVDPACPAQRLELRATSPAMASETQWTLRPLALERAP